MTTQSIYFKMDLWTTEKANKAKLVPKILPANAPPPGMSLGPATPNCLPECGLHLPRQRMDREKSGMMSPLHAFVSGEVSVPQTRQQWPGLVGGLRPRGCFVWNLFITVTHCFPQPKVSGLPPWAGCLWVSD